ncbi:hypothetical protein, partial [Sphingobacterium sp.]|uniref:hypothetical protein n=1 Tax=Sphingobacterium sp. TaxID=341027 RepID=UPI002897583E
YAGPRNSTRTKETRFYQSLFKIVVYGIIFNPSHVENGSFHENSFAYTYPVARNAKSIRTKKLIR